MEIKVSLEMKEENRKWGEKPYRSLDYELKKQFGEKVYKLALDGGMTCPNRDGTLGSHGCIFCSAGGSGEFAADKRLSVTEQIEMQKKALEEKKPARKYIAYFQAYTNTYAPVHDLRKLFTEAINHPDIVVLSIATRPDCLPLCVLELLEELNQIKPVWVELGLQTKHENTARLIQRGYELPVFEKAVEELRKRKISVIVHTILGLPGEREEEVLETIQYLNNQKIQGVKLQLLHVLKDTELARMYKAGDFQVLEKEAYLELVIRCLENLSPDITVHRLTGDGPSNLLLAPMWSHGKRTVLNTLHKKMKEKKTWQGRLCRK